MDKRMDKRILILNTGKIAGSIIMITLVFTFVLTRSPLKTVSPDSIRFMHFWQINFDHFNVERGTVKSELKTVYKSLKSSSTYDLNRGRYIQYSLYGIDGLTRWMLPSPMINFWMILILVINSALIAWISTRTVLILPIRVNQFCLVWVTLVSTSLVISPVILLILYAKYVWVTFVLAFFVSRNKLMKIIWLIAAAFSDEIGLFAAMIITFFTVVRFILAYYNVNPYTIHLPKYRTIKVCFYGIIASFTIMFVIYGISAVFFGETASGLRNFAFSGGKQLVQLGGWSSAFSGLLWRAEGLIFGSTLGYPILTTIVGLIVLIVILVGILKTGKDILSSEALQPRCLNDNILIYLSDKKGFFYINWGCMLLMINFIVLRSGAGDYTHYSYPAFAVLSILFIRSLVDILPSRHVSIVLSVILSIHLLMLPQTVTKTSYSLSNYLFPDRTVSIKDINAIKQSVLELRANGNSPFFDIINNGQEIDFSGTWFYSRVKGYGTATGPYFPIQGTIRVLLWPKKINRQKRLDSPS